MNDSNLAFHGAVELEPSPDSKKFGITCNRNHVESKRKKSAVNPVAARFVFSNTAIPNLFNNEGQPASSFRTDDW